MNEKLLERVKVLNERVWEYRVPATRIREWLKNFKGEVFAQDREQYLALTLLASFCYYGDKEVRALLVSLFRDHWQNPELRKLAESTTAPLNNTLAAQHVNERLKRTRFLGMGNPSESGSHLLYYFRQENELSRDLFVNFYDILSFPQDPSAVSLTDRTVDHLVFIDDVLGSGTQATRYSKGLLPLIRKAASHSGTSMRIDYLVLFAKSDGLKNVRLLKDGFDNVRAVHVLDPTQSAFAERSRLLGMLSTEELQEARQVAEHYGAKLFSGHPLGWSDGQLLLGFHHNIPNNTLPVFWNDEADALWDPIFPRYRKID